jgi:hypothetical protein
VEEEMLQTSMYVDRVQHGSGVGRHCLNDARKPATCASLVYDQARVVLSNVCKAATTCSHVSNCPVLVGRIRSS